MAVETGTFPRTERIIAALEAVNEAVGRTVAWLLVALVAVVVLVVVLRYGLDIGSIALQEAALYLHAFAFMLGVAYTLRHDGHVRVDIFYRRLSQRGRAAVDLAGTLLLLLPLMGFILAVSWGYAAGSWARLEGSPEPGGLPLVFLLKSAIPAMAILMILQGVALALRSALRLAGGAPPEAEPAAREL
ncbi:TRAP transporter small permease subunit [Thiohalospira sp.]|uniref:TRAP transporter small permease subunit n=1 Tax=Thiohalospira sp. TaxID=3080549 RepID=UPI00397F75C8